MAIPGRDRMTRAALIIARSAQARAARWSVRIPPSVLVQAGEDWAVISAQAGPAYPNEVIRVRHPVFGHVDRWVLNEHRPFLGPAAEAGADAAAAEIAKGVDDYCHSLGFKGAP
jgi:hypothetical protein